MNNTRLEERARRTPSTTFCCSTRGEYSEAEQIGSVRLSDFDQLNADGRRLTRYRVLEPPSEKYVHSVQL